MKADAVNEEGSRQKCYKSSVTVLVMKRKLVAILLAVSFIFSTAPAVFAAPIKIGISMNARESLTQLQQHSEYRLSGWIRLTSPNR